MTDKPSNGDRFKSILQPDRKASPSAKKEEDGDGVEASCGPLAIFGDSATPPLRWNSAFGTAIVPFSAMACSVPGSSIHPRACS